MNSQPKTDENQTETAATLETIQLRIEALITLVLMLIGAVIGLCACVVASAYGIFSSVESMLELALAAGLVIVFAGLFHAVGKVTRASIFDRKNFYDPNYSP